MSVDVATTIVIHRPLPTVAAYASAPDNAPNWYSNIKTVEWKTAPPLTVGSQIAFVARFLGRRLAYTYVITEFVPERRLVMRTSEGPFPMETIYTWEADAENSTRMTLQNRGEPAGFGRLAAPLMVSAMRRANQKDLAALKRILESID
ncbi:MAG: SRPBCC family protein [Polyangiaceae bacterium]